MLRLGSKTDPNSLRLRLASGVKLLVTLQLDPPPTTSNIFHVDYGSNSIAA
jgi:hypothetical protein